MRTGIIISTAASLAFGAAGAVSAATITTLNFSGNICGVGNDEACGDGSGIGQNYGDSVGVDVSSAVRIAADDTVVGPLRYWGLGYGDLTGIAWGNTASSAFEGTFTFAPNAGYEVRLLDFAVGCFAGRTSCATFNYKVTAGADTLASANLVSTNFPGSGLIALDTAWVSDSVTLRWGPDLFNTGLDNIRFEWRAIDNGGGGGGGAGVIPEPATWAMMIAGFGLVGAVARRRRTAVIA